MTAGPDDSWPWPNIERPPLTLGDDGWPLAVMVCWSAYNNDYGIDTCPAYWPIPDPLRDDGTKSLSKAVDYSILGVYRDGAWHAGGTDAVLDRLLEDAETRFPAGAATLLRTWSQERLPTWPELVSAARPDLTNDEVEAWLTCGLTRRNARFDLSLRRGCWQFDVPADWLQTVGPLVASLMDRGVFIVPWWADAALRESRLTLHDGRLPSAPEAYVRRGGHLTEWLCRLVSFAAEAADTALQLVTAWEHHLAGSLVRDVAPLATWDRLQGVPATWEYFGNSGLAPLSDVQRREIEAAARLLKRRLKELERAVMSAAKEHRPPAAPDVEAVRSAYDAAGVAHESAARLCRQLTASHPSS